eukprot:CAMPEP_0116033804 /NCGR_PEP_ID=MMETSP0321-20121206/19213_1 /TAXON_ID=163516 /ORGANISM="Leptocylindrus danicus var. danicus, Strain B650" /LENGTH=694 /DNA_ID=CAMNT_0003509961 /DNA_START=24 /DNA_END=2109 /DNA_ORIENTATION=+
MDVLLPPLEYTTYRQRLFFTDEDMHTMILKHVLNDAFKDGVPAKKKKSKQIREKENWPRELCVVGSRVLVDPQRLMLDGDKQTSSVFDVSLETEEEELDASPDGVDAMTYILRPGATAMTRVVAKKIKRFMGIQLRGQHVKERQLRRTQHNIIFMPHTSAICEAVLREEGIMSMVHEGTVSILELPVDLIPLDEDVLSLEQPSALKECAVDGVPTHTIQTVAASLVKIQEAFGVVKRVEGLGPLAEDVIIKMMSMRMDDYEIEATNACASARDQPLNESFGMKSGGNIGDNGGSAQDFIQSDIDAMIIMDRTLDLVTPMLTPLTYEGLVDDIIGMKNGHIKVKLSLVDPDDEEVKNNPSSALPEPKVSIALNGGDTLFAEVRGQNVEKIGSFLQDQAKALRESHANFTNRDKSLSEIHKFVKHIPVFTQNYRSLTQHINLAALVKKNVDEPAFRQRWQTEREMLEGSTCYDQLDELIYTQHSPFRLLKLLCLQSITSGGIKSSKYDAMRRDIVQTYGYEFLFVLSNIEKLGALRQKAFLDTSGSFSIMRKWLSLINEDVDTIEPDDISYVSSGYAPLSVRLIQAACKGWINAEDVLRELPGHLIDVIQVHPPETCADALKRPIPRGLALDDESVIVESNKEKQKPVLLVYFIGGVTYMEIHSLRFLSQLPKFPYRIVCCTTAVVNGETMLRDLV